MTLQLLVYSGTLCHGSVMDWLPRGPELKIIDAVWDHFDGDQNKN